mgnify:CR=1 FL=1
MCNKEGKSIGTKDKEGTAVTTNFVYRAIVPKGKENKIPVISKEKLKAFKADVAKYRRKK